MAGGTISWERVRKAGSKLTTPLHPDDYLSLVNPLWSSRELRGRIDKVIPETEDAATLIIRPGWGWRYDHSPGQYVGIAIQVDGKFQWRSYSVSSAPKRDGRHIAITVRAMPEGLLSTHLVKGLEPGTTVRLALPEGDFTLPDPPPATMLFLVGGSGVTPVMAMLRTLDRRGTMPDVVMHYSSTSPERMIFRDELSALAEKHDGLTLHLRHTDTEGIVSLGELDELCSDWRERSTWACGPGPMLDDVEELFEQAGLSESLHLERIRKGQKDPKEMTRQLRQIVSKGRNQILKDYVVYPALSGPHWKSTLTANMTANLTRNLWSYMIIFCGHFPDGAMHFTEEELEDETRSEWYLRQMLGSANFDGGRPLHILSGSLGYQIEHHLFPDLPSNRYPEIAVKVRALCDKYDIPYTTGPLHRQYGQVLRTILKLSLPNKMTTSDDPAPPTRSDTADEPALDRGRMSDEERQPRRSELGGWSRSPRERSHD